VPDESVATSLNTADIFARLAEQLEGYEHRSQQLDLALDIERTFALGKTGLFEAGTGTGKSFAALIPAALSHKRVVISTNTISLQEQYINKDIPALQKVLPFEIQVSLMKGRGNYLGIRRWDDYIKEFGVDDRLIQWVSDTESGDISELDFVPHYEVWNEVNSDSDDCLRNRCPQYNNCFYFDSRRQADKADIIIVNHALLLADAASMGNILPAYDLLIVDEAHHLPDVATNAFSLSISNRGLRALCTKAIKKVSAPAGIIHEIESQGFAFFQHLNQSSTYARTRVRKPMEDAADLADTLHLLKRWLEEQTFENYLDVDQSREKAKLKAKSIISTLNAYLTLLDYLANPDPNWVIWIERNDLSGSRIAVIAAPLDPSTFLRNQLLEKDGLTSSVWMSATLATVGEDPFDYFKRTIGLDKVIQSQVPSPFDYAQQACIYLPQRMPEPNQKEFLPRAADEIERILEVSEGRAFVLFTSRASMNTVFEMIGQNLAYPCMKQGDMPRLKLIEWFRATDSAVLFGTSSFWEGVSIDGDQLSCVIIDRIPFQVPDDPVYEARCDALKEDGNGRSWFKDLALPHATMRLKQGVGRLIRTATDRGMVAILDPRMTSKAYGRAILECLPPMRIVRHLDEIYLPTKSRLSMR
jgi:ATP-dependent DNA helicase DinG